MQTRRCVDLPHDHVLAQETCKQRFRRSCLPLFRLTSSASSTAWHSAIASPWPSPIQSRALSLSFRSDLHIRRLQIAMDDTFFMGSFECFTDGFGNIESFFNWNRTPCNTIGERLPLDKFKYKEARAIHFFQIVDRADVRMVQRCENLGLALESCN